MKHTIQEKVGSTCVGEAFYQTPCELLFSKPDVCPCFMDKFFAPATSRSWTYGIAHNSSVGTGQPFWNSYSYPAINQVFDLSKRLDDHLHNICLWTFVCICSFVVPPENSTKCFGIYYHSETRQRDTLDYCSKLLLEMGQNVSYVLSPSLSFI